MLPKSSTAVKLSTLTVPVAGSISTSQTAQPVGIADQRHAAADFGRAIEEVCTTVVPHPAAREDIDRLGSERTDAEPFAQLQIADHVLVETLIPADIARQVGQQAHRRFVAERPLVGENHIATRTDITRPRVLRVREQRSRTARLGVQPDRTTRRAHSDATGEHGRVIAEHARLQASR